MFPPGLMPTQVRYPGDWTGSEKLNNNYVEFHNLNYDFWDTIFSDQIIEFLDEPSIKQEVFLDLLNNARADLMSLRAADAFHSIDGYTEKMTGIIKYLKWVSKKLGEIKISLMQGIYVKNLCYGRSEEILNKVRSATKLEKMLSNVIGQKYKDADLVLVDIISEYELLTALISVKAIKKANPNVKVALVRHEFENFSMKSAFEDDEIRKNFELYFDNIVDNSTDVDSNIIQLIECSEKKTESDSRLKTEFRESSSNLAENLRMPLIKAFTPEETISMRFSKNRCYWSKCDFCAQANKHRKGEHNSEKIDAEHMNRIIRRIEKLNRRGYKRIIFSDEAIKSEDVITLSKLILKQGISIKWSYRSRIDFGLSRENMEMIRSAGCEEVIFGLESASETVLRSMNKYSEMPEKDLVRSYLKELYNAGVNIHLNLIVGFPGETCEQLKETFSFVNDTFEGAQGITFSMNQFRLFKNSQMIGKHEEHSITPLVKEGDLYNYCDYDDYNKEYCNETFEAAVELGWKQMVQALGLGHLLDSVYDQLALMLIFNGLHGLIIRSFQKSMTTNRVLN